MVAHGALSCINIACFVVMMSGMSSEFSIAFHLGIEVVCIQFRLMFVAYGERLNII